MSGFNPLEGPLKDRGHYFLEASAGTGKTFAIIHLATRLVLERSFRLDELLLVTFTNKAAHELCCRLRLCLEQTLDALEERIPPFCSYLKTFLEQPREAVFLAKAHISRQLAHFEQANIFTLHGFACHILQKEGKLSPLFLENVQKPTHFEEVAKDVLRQVDLLFSTQQLERLLAHYGFKISALIEDAKGLVQRHLPITYGAPYGEIKQRFIKACALFGGQSVQKAELKEWLESYASALEGMKDRTRQLKQEVKREIDLFVQNIFDPIEPPWVPLVVQMGEAKLLKNAKMPARYEPWDLLKSHVLPLLQEMMDPLALLGVFAEACRLKISQTRESEVVFYDDLLVKLQQALQSGDFVAKVRGQYKALFIDEFQDVDALLWDIFEKLFISRSDPIPIFLIGDPKQSIYRFRKADLYTYLRAKNRLTSEPLTLSTNYRSSPKLVASLNDLFLNLPTLFALPNSKNRIEYTPLQAGRNEGAFCIEDEKEPIHFIKAKNQQELYEAVCGEIEHLRAQKIHLGQIAVLVRDRFSAARFMRVASDHDLKVVSRHSRQLSDSVALEWLYDLFMGAIDESRLDYLLAGPLFLCSLPATRKEIFYSCLQATTGGVLSFWRRLEAKMNIAQSIALQKEAESIYSDLLQLVEIMASRSLSIREAIAFLKQLKVQMSPSDEMRARSILAEHAIQLLTIHASKGLEFDIVFALGLTATSHKDKQLLVDEKNRRITFNEALFAQHLQEEASEEMRLLYVACTRARERLYLPYVEDENDSMIGRFLSLRQKVC